MIGQDDPLARYLFQTSHYSSQNKRVKQGAFLPDGNLETSVYLIKDLSEEEIWTHGETYAANGRTLRARATTKKGALDRVKLTLQIVTPPPLHANIVGWPAGKDEQKALALELAQSAELTLRS